MQGVRVVERSDAIVEGWRLVDHVQLLLRVRGQSDEVRMICRCDRAHWIVREHREPEGARLLATCHSCGTRFEFILAGTILRHA